MKNQELCLVVNCLKSFYFAVSKTTTINRLFVNLGCELLEKFLLRSIKNNNRTVKTVSILL